MKSKYTNKEFHHSTIMKEKCSGCGRNFRMFWDDESEKNGFSETRYGFDEKCLDCKTKETGRKPLTLQELNDQRKNKS